MLRPTRLPTRRFLERNYSKTEWEEGWTRRKAGREGSLAAGSNKGQNEPVSACLRHRPWVSCPSPRTLASLPSGTHRTTHKNTSRSTRSPDYTPSPRCPTWQQASGVDFSNTFERFVWLHLTLLKVAGANWSTSSTAAYSHLERPGPCFLDIFTAFKFLLLLSLLLGVMQAHNSCITDGAEFWTWCTPNIPMEHFLDISCFALYTSDFTFTWVFFF